MKNIKILYEDDIKEAVASHMSRGWNWEGDVELAIVETGESRILTAILNNVRERKNGVSE